jgi:hypothetical protein
MAGLGSYFMALPIFVALLSPDWLSALADCVMSVAVGALVGKAVERRHRH